jgi:hypothetical protein
MSICPGLQGYRVPRTLMSLTNEGRSAKHTYRENMKQVLDEMLAS